MRSLPISHRRPLAASMSVLGLGKTGISATRYLASKGVDVVASDQRSELTPGVREDLEMLGAKIVLGDNIVRPGDLVVISPGISPHNQLFKVAHEIGSEVISEPELFARQFGKPIIAISGTDGKSTVTTWTAHLLSSGGLNAVAGGNLGNPLIDELSDASLDIAVLEISAFQLITTPTLSPAVAAITNLADDHLDYFAGDALAYANAKKHLLDLCGPDSLILLPSDNPPTNTWRGPAGTKRILVGLKPEAGVSGWLDGVRLMIQVPDQDPEFLLNASELPLVGLHNVRNALYASLMARWVGMDLESIRRGLVSYRALPHRCTVVRVIDGVQYINDSKATTPNATMAALNGIKGSIILIVGGSDKGSDYTALGGAISTKTRLVIGMGATADDILGAVDAEHPQAQVTDLEEALHVAQTNAAAGDIVLLSPACASFDQFENYGHRGQVFTGLVEALKGSSTGS